MKNSFLFFFLLSFVFTGFAQQTVTLTPLNADCNHPVEIKDTLLISTNSPQGPGSILEITGNDKKDLHFFEQEHNTAWYWFKVKNDAELSFDIIPVSVNDDYDLSLYRCDAKSFCSDVKEKKILPVRTCISRNDKKSGSKTGLRTAATDEFIHSGIGASYVKSMEVKKGEVYFLIVDNVYPNGKGHSIHFHYKLKEEPIKPVTATSKEPPAKKEIVLEAGKSFSFDNIQFYPGQDAFLPTARPALDSLLDIMKKNPTLKIEIQGHVNEPFTPNNPAGQSLSEARAEAVFEFLKNNSVFGTHECSSRKHFQRMK
jgi:outer membrane protein OmpA-like peptidoglycan-associated protein